MAFDASFLVALALLIVGSGCLKGNISAQVGRLYPPEAESRRTQGYTIFSAAINVGAVVGPLVCGGLAAAYGWHVGFGAAGALMIVALITYLAGQRHLPGGRVPAEAIVHPPLTPAERRRTWLLIGVIVLTVLPNIAYPMIWNIGLIWIDGHVDLPRRSARSPQAGSIRSMPGQHHRRAAARRAVALAGEARARAGRHRQDRHRLGAHRRSRRRSSRWGACCAGADGRVAVYWPLLGYAGMGIAFLYYWPVLLALISQAAPAKMNATLMGGAFLSFSSAASRWAGSAVSTTRWPRPASGRSTRRSVLPAARSSCCVGRPLARALEPAPPAD